MDTDIALATTATEGEFLNPWLSAFERVFAQPAQLEAEGDGEAILTSPRVIDPIELVGSANHFKMHPAVAEHVRQLGFAWEQDARILTVPTPATFNQRLAKYGRSDAGFRVAWVCEEGSTLSLGPWLHRYMRGILSVQTCSRKYFDAMLAQGPKGLYARPLPSLLSSLIHDLSVHALNYHLIPHTVLRDLASRIEAAVPERAANWLAPKATAPVTLTYFFDNDLNRYAYAVWCRTRKPEEFERLFTQPKSYEQLLAALDTRLQETLAGVGDVPEGEFNRMQPLKETRFEIV